MNLKLRLCKLLVCEFCKCKHLPGMCKTCSFISAELSALLQLSKHRVSLRFCTMHIKGFWVWISSRTNECAYSLAGWVIRIVYFATASWNMSMGMTWEEIKNEVGSAGACACWKLLVIGWKNYCIFLRSIHLRSCHVLLRCQTSSVFLHSISFGVFLFFWDLIYVAIFWLLKIQHGQSAGKAFQSSCAP